MLPISASLGQIISGTEKVPVAMAYVYDTSYTVPSKGIFVSYFSGVDPNASGAIKRTQFESTIMHDWAGGLPVELSNYVGIRVTSSGTNVSDPFSITYSGYFYAASSGVYNFATRSNAGTEMFLDNRQLLTGYILQTPILTGYSTGVWPNKPHYWAGQTPLNTGWHNFKLNLYWQMLTGFVGNPFLTAFYTDPIKNQETILSPSTVSYQSQFLAPTILPNLIMAKESIDHKLSTQFDFEVAMKISGVYNWDKTKENFGLLKINKLCKIFMGYVTESGYTQTSGYTTNLDKNVDGMIERFTGMIDSVEVTQKTDSLTANVKCRDFFKKSINTVNANYPNRSNYTPEILSGLDSKGFFQIDSLMPNAYDRWPVFDVIETIALNSNIDPARINKDKWDNHNHFTMEGNINWPFTNTYDVNGVETYNGDPYIFQFQYGEMLFDEINKVADLVGYNVYFDETGDLVVKEPTRTNRIEIYETGNYGSQAVLYSGAWSTSVNVNASNRLYTSPSGTNGIVQLRFSGVGFGLYNSVHPSGNLYTVSIYDTNNNLVFNNMYTNLGLGTTWGYLNTYTRDLPFGTYNAFIYPSGDIRIEGFEYYTQNIYKPVYTLTDTQDAISIQISQDDSSVRNEVIGVGQQISDQGYIYSKAIDLDSISNPDAPNYVGEKRTFTFIEPTIQSQQRLDWLAKTILGKFSRKQRSFNIQTQGLPHIQINDPIGISSSNINLNSNAISTFDINNQEVYYVTSISSDLSQGKYTSTFTLTNLKPLESWTPSLSITDDVLNLIYASNQNTIFANYTQDTLNSTFGYGYDGFSRQAAFISFDLLIDVDRLWVLVADDNNVNLYGNGSLSYGGSVFQNIDVKSPNPLLTFQAAKGQDPNQPPQSAVWLHNGGGEGWGHITVPTAQNAFNGGQWAGQNSLSNVRLNGKYPIAIWAQFRTSNNVPVYQGLWTLDTGLYFSGAYTSGWSTTSDGNTYISYTATNDTGFQSIQTPVNPSLKLANMPAFSVADEPLFIDLFIGPEASGYQMVSQNLLMDMSKNFMYGGSGWNCIQNVKSTNGIDDFSKNLNKLEVNLGSTSLALGAQELATAYNMISGVWNIGDNIMISGVPQPINITAGQINRSFFVGGGIDATLNTGYKRPKEAFGWGPQGFDIVPVSQITGYIKRNGYNTPIGLGGEEVKWDVYLNGSLENFGSGTLKWTSTTDFYWIKNNITGQSTFNPPYAISGNGNGQYWLGNHVIEEIGPTTLLPANNTYLVTGVIETVANPWNYILLKTNHDIYLEYDCYLISSQTQEIWIYENPYNGELLWLPQNPQQGVLGLVYKNQSRTIPSVTVYKQFHKYITTPFKSPLAIYLEPGDRNAVIISGVAYHDASNFWYNNQPYYTSFKNNFGYNVFNFQVDSPELDTFFHYASSDYPNLGNDASVLHYFTLTEAKTGRRQYFNMRTTPGKATLGPVGGSLATSDDFYTKVPLYANINSPFVSPRIIS